MRQSNSVTKTLCLYRKDTKSGGSENVSYSDTYLSSTSSRSDITKVKADASGWRQPTPYAASFSESVPWTGSVYWLDDYDAWGGGTDFIKTTFTGNLENLPSSIFPNQRPSPLVLPTVPSSSVYGTALNRALSKLKDQQVQYATFLAESGEAASMLMKNMRLISKSIHLIKKGRFKEAAAELQISPKAFKSRKRPRSEREVSARWLEAQYGWLPLVSDSFGIYEDVRKGFFREPRVSVRARATDESSVSAKLASSLYNGTVVNTTISSCTIRLDYVLDSEKLRIAVQKGLTNPVEVAWELVPYSFIVDWFAPVGDYLSALDADFGVSFRGGSYTMYSVSRAVGEIQPTKWTSSATHRYSQGGLLTSSKLQTSMDRRVYSSSPSGSLFIKNPLSLQHVANALALFHQRIR